MLSFNDSNDFVRDNAGMILDLLPGETSFFLKYLASIMSFRQSKASIDDQQSWKLLFDNSVEISIFNVTFACKVGCQIDESE